jgi:hypothetical protein
VSTKGIIDRVVPWCPGWARSSGKKNLLKVLEQGLDKLFNWDDESMIWRGSDNQGFPPYLTPTLAGTYDYDVIAANLSCGAITRDIGGTSYTMVARKVNKVFIDITQADYDETAWFGTPYYLNTSPYAISNTRRQFVDYKISSQPAYENTPPRVKFLTDPGATTDTFFIEFFIGCPRLTSESIRIPIPEEFEVDLENYIIGFVQWRESGRPGDNITYFENVTIPKFRAMMSSCANPVPTRTPPNYC